MFALLSALAVFPLTLYMAYQWALPLPIEGIPYSQQAAERPFGDLLTWLRYARKTGEIWSWVPSQVIGLDSPIIQLFIQPFSKPWVVISDFRESQDILLRRTAEFDRSDDFAMVLSGLIPDNHINMPSSNPEFKAHRRLIQDLMTPAFLNKVAAPHVHTAFTSLMGLWSEKARLAEGRPFPAGQDVYSAALDAIWAVTFPYDHHDGIIIRQLGILSQPESNPIKAPSLHREVQFPKATMNPAQNAIMTLTESIETAVKSPLPGLTHWFLRWLPYMRGARIIKENMISDELERAKARLSGGENKEHTCAMDSILHRELIAASKEGRKPVYNTRAIYDELFGLLIAGHDTVSTTIAWGLKLLTNHPQVQEKLREALHASFPEAVTESRQPSAQEITSARIPYLEAVREEIIRKSMTASMVSRVATVDSIVLGRRIPKGTKVFLLGNGPGYVRPPVGGDGGAIPEELRSEKCRASAANGHRITGFWDPQDCDMFRPERWLTMDGQGKMVFDSAAGPLLTFGLGPRGCFGRRMAYLELKTFLVLLSWNFELLDPPRELNGSEAVDKLTHQPKQCYLSLRRVSSNVL